MAIVMTLIPMTQDIATSKYLLVTIVCK